MAEFLVSNVRTLNWSSIAIPLHIAISISRIVDSTSRVNLIESDPYVLILGQLVDKIRCALRVDLLLPLTHDSKLNVDALNYSVVRHVVVKTKLLIQILINL